MVSLKFLHSNMYRFISTYLRSFGKFTWCFILLGTWPPAGIILSTPSLVTTHLSKEIRSLGKQNAVKLDKTGFWSQFITNIMQSHNMPLQLDFCDVNLTPVHHYPKILRDFNTEFNKIIIIMLGCALLLLHCIYHCLK